MSTVSIAIPSYKWLSNAFKGLHHPLHHSDLKFLVLGLPTGILRMLATAVLETNKKAGTLQKMLLATTGLRPPLAHANINLIFVCFPFVRLGLLAPTTLEDTNKADTWTQNATTALWKLADGLAFLWLPTKGADLPA